MAQDRAVLDDDSSTVVMCREGKERRKEKEFVRVTIMWNATLHTHPNGLCAYSKFIKVTLARFPPQSQLIQPPLSLGSRPAKRVP
jgi:hypothetical protein